MSLYGERSPRPAEEIERNLRRVWVRRGGRHGVEFIADHPDGRELLVRKVSWIKPGFSGKKEWGWGGFVSTGPRAAGAMTFEQQGAAYPRSCDAKQHIERVTKADR